MNIRTIRNLIISVVVGVVIALFIFHRMPAPGEGNLKEQQKAQRIFKELGFSSEQIKTLNQKRFAQEQSAGLLLEKIKLDMSVIKKEFDKIDPNLAEVARVAAEMKVLQGQLIDLRIQGLNEVRAIMTPQQFIKFQRMMKDLSRPGNPFRN